MVDPEVLETREESDEIQDLPGSAFGFHESEESNGWRQVPKPLLDVRHEAGYLQVVYSELLEVCERGKVVQIVSVKSITSKLSATTQADPESLDERKQPKAVRLLEWRRPPELLDQYITGEGVVKMMDGGDIPRMAG